MPPVISPARPSPFQATSPVSLPVSVPGRPLPLAPHGTPNFDRFYELDDAGPDQFGKVRAISPMLMPTGLGDGRAWPLFTAELAPEAAEFIRLLRLWSIDAGRLHGNSPLYALRRTLGQPDALAAYEIFRRIVALMAEGQLRRFRIHAPMCPCLTADEAALAAFCQACGLMDIEAGARAAWLVRAPQAPALAAETTTFYRVLQRLAASA